MRQAHVASTMCSFLRRNIVERELWSVVTNALKTLPARRIRNARYSDAQVLAVLVWAAMHQRPVSWACKRSSWSPYAWRRQLPDQSTVSRRLRSPEMPALLRQVVHRIQRHLPDARFTLADGKALFVKNQTRDPDAATGFASGRFGRGYKLHAIVDDQHRIHAWSILPLNKAEQPECRRLLPHMSGPRARGRLLLLGDAGYNSNPLFAAARKAGLRLVAPRCKPEMGLGWKKHDPDRLSSKRLTEDRGGWMGPMLKRLRSGVERYFSGLGSGAVNGGELPPWARRLHRVSLWIDAKVVLNAARIEVGRRLRA